MNKHRVFLSSIFPVPVLAALVCLLLAGGCAVSRHGDGDSRRAAFVVPGSDDDSPLTSAERAILQTPGKAGITVPPGSMPEVTRQYTHFLRKGRGVMSVFSKRAEMYLAYARRVFRSRGMPEELAYLAIVESGYKSDARSPAGAVGAWQFMPGTGKKFGLTQNGWLDERLDPYRSTEAAAAYLQKLYGYFGDWPTAIAAYNAGEGKIGRALEGTGGRNFFDVVDKNHMLDEKARLREETRKYVPRFIAVAKIMDNLPALGFEPIYPEKSRFVLRYAAPPGTDLAGLAKACHLKREELVAYNRHHMRSVTTPHEQSFVYLPAAHDAQASAFLRSARTYAGWHAAGVQVSGDTWEKISRRANVPVETLKAVNPDVRRLQAGQSVIVPRHTDMSAAAVAASDKSVKSGDGRKLNAPSKSGKKTYTVRQNDNLWNIARKHSVSVDDLKRWNNIDGKTLRAGTTLVVMQ